MSNQIDNTQTESDESGSGTLATVSDILIDVVTGTSIPAPIRKNAFKAFAQLCTVAIDVPVAYLEGKAAEKRAETQARIKIISTSGDQIASQMSVDPEFAHAAVKKYGEKIIRERININKACEAAARQLQLESVGSKAEESESTETVSINDDWLNQFEREASLKSTEDMQLLFGRILAGEIQKPSSYSIKSLKLLGELDSPAAMLFQRLCSLCISLKLGDKVFDARVVSFNGNAASNSLQRYGLSFDQLNLLQEHGLIISDYNSWLDYRHCIANKDGAVATVMEYQKRDWGLISAIERSMTQELRLHGVALSRSGKELLNIVNVELDEDYSSALHNYFNGLNLNMVEIRS